MTPAYGGLLRGVSCWSAEVLDGVCSALIAGCQSGEAKGDSEKGCFSRVLKWLSTIALGELWAFAVKNPGSFKDGPRMFSGVFLVILCVS